MDLLGNLNAVIMVIVALSPLVVSVLKREGWPRWAKVLLAGVVAFATATARVFIDSGLDVNLDTIVVNGAAFFVAMQVAYSALWEQTKVEAALRNV